MERLEKLVNILKLTPHRQPELVKEAVNIITSRQLKCIPQIGVILKPVLEVLIKYCDDDDSAQRSLFNDSLNTVILTFQNQHYQLILKVLFDELSENGSARTLAVVLQRIPQLITNIRPIELGYESQKLLKSLIEVARRPDDELVQKALESTLKQLMPYLEHDMRKGKDVQFLCNTLVETLLRNLHNDSSQTKRSAAASIAHIAHSSENQLLNILTRLKSLLDMLATLEPSITANKLAGFCLCVKKIPKLAHNYHVHIIDTMLKQIEFNYNDATLMNPVLEILRDLYKFKMDMKTLVESASMIVNKFLLVTDSTGVKVIKADVKVTLQVNALGCVSQIIRQHPKLLDEYQFFYQFKDNSDIAIRNQVIVMIGNYIEASWRFPQCLDRSVDCERIRKLWLEIRFILHDETVHPDILKSCVLAIKACIGVLFESDHCLHIVEYCDIEHLISLYTKSNFKPFKIEVLNLFASMNYRTLHYLERSHWLKQRAQTTGIYLESLQDRIVNIILMSIIDEHQRIRSITSSALVSMIPNLYITNLNNTVKNVNGRFGDPIVSYASDLTSEHLVVLEHVDEHVNHSNGSDDSTYSSDLHETTCIKNGHIRLSSSIIQSQDNPYNEHVSSRIDIAKSQHRVNVATNLMYILGLLKRSIESNLDKGKTAVSSIVKTFQELSIVYPIHQYSRSWDCRPSEYCECFTLLNFLLAYMENLNEPDVIIEDLDAYKSFLALSQQLLYALCHESVLIDYEHQKMKPYHKRQAEYVDGSWSDLNIKHPWLVDILQVFFTHLTKLLWLISCIIEEKINPFSSTKHNSNQQGKLSMQETLVCHDTLVSNTFLFGRIYKKLESSYRSSKKILNQKDEKFYQILETCLSGISSLLEFIGMSRSIDCVHDILGYLKITSSTCSVSSLICARQMLKSLFGINILALYQLDPNDWFEEVSWSPSPTNPVSGYDSLMKSLPGVYYHLISQPSKIFSDYCSMNCSRITPTSNRALEFMSYESRRALRVRKRIEHRIRTLFDMNVEQPISPRVRRISEDLRNTITQFTTIVIHCMTRFMSEGFSQYQSETLHLMSYLILLRVNYQKLPLAMDFINNVHKLLDACGDKKFACREEGIENLLRNSFTFLTLLTYERGPTKPLFMIPSVIQKLDDLRAKLSILSDHDIDTSRYVVPPLRCLVEDLFIYRTKEFQKPLGSPEPLNDTDPPDTKDAYEILEAERETVAQKLLDIVDDPDIYDLLCILLLESRQNSSEIKYKKLSRHLLSIIPRELANRKINIVDYKRIELTRRIIENTAPEVFHPVNFILETLLRVPTRPLTGADPREFQRWMSLVIISVHILTTQVKEEVFLTRLREILPEEEFVEYLLHIAQLCVSEIYSQLFKAGQLKQPNIEFLIQELSCYILYLTHMFQSGLFLQLTRIATDLIKREIKREYTGPKSFEELCTWARDPCTGFSLDASENMFFSMRLEHPDLTIFWCDIMILLNNVDCNREYWRNLLVYDCHHCLTSGKSSRNSIITNNEEGQLLVREVTAGNTEQCLSPSIELTRRGALCLVLDFVTIGMNDVEHITWLIIHHINEIIRWSHESPIMEFITAIHGNSASSGIFIQAINKGFNNITSISLITRLIWTLEKVHYTQYGSLVVLLVEMLLTSQQLVAYRSLTKRIEEFACSTVKKLLNETNKNLVTTNDEVTNQLTADDLDRIVSLLDVDLYPDLTKLLTKLRDSTSEEPDVPMIELRKAESDSDDDSIVADEKLVQYSKADIRRKFEETWVTLLGELSTSLFQSDQGDRRANLSASCRIVTAITKHILSGRGDRDASPQSFDERVIELTKSISTNLSTLMKKTRPIYESLESERVRFKQNQSTEFKMSPKSATSDNFLMSSYSPYLRVPAQKLRMNSILNLELSLQDTVVVHSDSSFGSHSDEVDVESCIRLLLSIYKQKITDPNESLCRSEDKSKDAQAHSKQNSKSPHNKANQLAPPLATAISQSVLALSDLFTDYEQFDWLFETFVQLFKMAERNEDEIQMQFLILGLCKSTAVCCYEIPTDLNAAAAVNHRDVIFEKCRQSIEKCVKSEFGPLKLNALYGAYYLLEDSINIVASGAWELDDFRRLRQSRLTWILKLMDILLDRENSRLLTRRTQVMKLLELLCDTVLESEMKTIKG